MPAPENNLLLCLHKWAARQNENFLTETLAHLLRYLLLHEAEAAVRLVEKLTHGFIALKSPEARTLEISTQVVLADGTPDVRLLRPGKQLAYIEVKAESDLGQAQLQRYRKLLDESGVPATALFVLTRYPVVLPEGGEQPYLLRWYQVAEWIEQERGRYSFQPVSAFLVHQFLEFLGAKNMSMGQVTWELAGGVRALRTLSSMLYEAASACGLKAQLRGSADGLGVYLEGARYWTGVEYEWPEYLIFSLSGRPASKAAADKLGLTVDERKNKHDCTWHREINLESEDVHFFARSKQSQLEWVEQFLKESLALAKQIELPESSSPPVGADEAPST